MKNILILRAIHQAMGNIGFKYRYLFASICLLGAFWYGYNFNGRHAIRNSVKKRVSILYSFSKNELGCGQFEEFLRLEFRKQGIDPQFDKFYVGADDNNLCDETRRVQRYLEIIKSKPIDLIMTVGDQSTSSLLSTRHPVLYSLPVVACNVHFPDEKLIKEYESKNVYILRDTPDFRSNIEFIRTLQNHANIEILYNVDFTALGHKSFDLLTHTVDRKNVRVVSSESSFPIEYEYKELKEMVKYYSLMPAVARENIKKNKLTISLCPFRYMKGAPLLVMMQKSKSEQGRKAFLLDKFDLVSLPLVNALNIPSFSCLREGFGEGTKIVGGYMATDEISARTAADISVRLMSSKEKAGIPQVLDMEKEYVLNWTYFSSYSGFHVKNVPANVRIINYPFYDHYREELYFLGGIFILAFVLVSVILLRTRRRSVIERRNMKILEEAHKRLTLSAGGGQISLWNIQGNEVEFDDNYSSLTGLEQRRFTKEQFLKYVYPDDFQAFSSFCEALRQLSDIQKQRARFCFGENGKYQWYEFRCRNLKDTSGKTMLAGIMQNIQETVERENQLIIAKQMAENAELKQSFLNNISHEIRTPLNAIVGFTNLLVGEGADEIRPEEKVDMLKIINHNNGLLLKLVDDVMEISSLDTGNTDFEIKEWNMTEVIKGLYKTHQPLMQASLEFILDLDENVSLPVNIDYLRFAQVISNFLSNANKFTRSGHITLGCYVDKEHNEVRIYVEDSGKGIDEKELMMIFDRFYKTDEFEQGSGLGLAISKVIVERLSGRIEVHSEVGKGSRFTVILPLA